MIRPFTLTGLLVLAVTGCSPSSSSMEREGMTDAERSAIATEVRAAVDAFAEAERRRDPEAALSFLHPDFYMYGDGVRGEYDSVVEGIRSFLPSLERFDTEWTDIEVIPLGSEHALVSLIFHDDLLARDGTRTRQWGPNTFIWHRFDDGWKIIYTDADHYPDPSSEEGSAAR